MRFANRLTTAQSSDCLMIEVWWMPTSPHQYYAQLPRARRGAGALMTTNDGRIVMIDVNRRVKNPSSVAPVRAVCRHVPFRW
jgi:hypothetical protein